MLRRTVSLRLYSRVCWACLVSLYLIIVTGSLVRLTGSGLGCSDWPRCSDQHFVDVSSTHAAIEQLNRLLTGVVAAVVIAATLLSLLLRPRRRQITWLSIGLVGGVLAQVLIGAVVVISGLHPGFNMAHYLVSIVLVTMSFSLLRAVHRLREDTTHRPLDELSGSLKVTISRSTRQLIGLVVVLLAGVLIAGTVVTGSGPHAGDETAPRFSLDIGSVARIHSFLVWATIACVILLFDRLRRKPSEWPNLSKPLQIFLAVLMGQGFLGYYQYFLGVPAGLVAIHVALSVAAWISALSLLDAARNTMTFRQFVLD